MATATAKFIKVKTKDNEKFEFAIQQYEIGLYVCIYQDGRMVEQFSSKLSEQKFIDNLKNDENLTIIED